MAFGVQGGVVLDGERVTCCHDDHVIQTVTQYEVSMKHSSCHMTDAPIPTPTHQLHGPIQQGAAFLQPAAAAFSHILNNFLPPFICETNQGFLWHEL